MQKYKKLIVNSDDFGLSHAYNEGIRRGFLNGIITSTCICANGEAFDEAIEFVENELAPIGLGVHLNIIEGRALSENKFLTDEFGFFNNGFATLMIKSLDKDFMAEVEVEFRAQIEKVLAHKKPDHLNSHVHVHGIPAIFDLTCKLAKEYGIEYVRTQYENCYFVPSFKKHCQWRFYINLIKVLLLNSFTIRNSRVAKKHGIKTNDKFVGVRYTGYMDADTIRYGLSSIKSNALAEVLIHPTYFDRTNIEKPDNFGEYLAGIDEDLIKELDKSDWISTNYKELSKVNLS